MFISAIVTAIFTFGGYAGTCNTLRYLEDYDSIIVAQNKVQEKAKLSKAKNREENVVKSL